MGCGGSKSKADANGGGGSGGLSAGQDSNLGARETSFMSPATLSAVAKEANVTLEEAEVLYLRFKLLEPDHTTNEVLVTHFGHKIGTGYRHNSILLRFVRSIHMDDAMLDLLTFIKLLKWWKLADPRQKAERVFDLFDGDEDGVLDRHELDQMLLELAMIAEGCGDDDYPEGLLVLLVVDSSGMAFCHKKMFVTYMLDHAIVELKQLLNPLDTDVYDDRGQRIDTNIMKDKV